MIARRFLPQHEEQDSDTYPARQSHSGADDVRCYISPLRYYLLAVSLLLPSKKIYNDQGADKVGSGYAGHAKYALSSGWLALLAMLENLVCFTNKNLTVFALELPNDKMATANILEVINKKQIDSTTTDRTD
jgi:hypothetical protein